MNSLPHVPSAAEVDRALLGVGVTTPELRELEAAYHAATWGAALCRKPASEAALAGHRAASEALAIIRAREATDDYRTGRDDR